MSEDATTTINVQTSGRDWAVSVSKGVLGTVPYIGPLVGEVVGNLIPDQRVDRISRLVEALEAKLKHLERQQLHAVFHDEEFIDLLEDGFFQAARARSQERIERIATLLERRITREEVSHSYAKRLLALLGEISDDEVILLLAYSVEVGRDDAFRKQHKHLLRPPPATLNSSQEVLDENTMHHARLQNLIRLDLLSPNFKQPKKGEMPDFDMKTGKVTASGYELTPLGRLLLRTLGQIDKF